MAEPARKQDLGEDLLSRQQEEQAKQWIEEARAASAARGQGREPPPRERRDKRAVDSIKPAAPANLALSTTAPLAGGAGATVASPAAAAATPAASWSQRWRALQEQRRRGQSAAAPAQAEAAAGGTVQRALSFAQIAINRYVLKAAFAAMLDPTFVLSTLSFVYLNFHYLKSRSGQSRLFRPMSSPQKYLLLFIDVIFPLTILAGAALLIVLFQKFGGLGTAALKFLK